WILVLDGQALRAKKTLDLISHHPLTPLGLFRVWDLPGQLLSQLKPRMNPAENHHPPTNRNPSH
ncbi:MAG: hypothetical protein MI799_05980, partial [Desulfobacterales bacterium]|nr:hypothetical protein [Desulfobacterales bacterium]